MKATRCKECGKKSYPSERRAIGAALGNTFQFGGWMRYYRCPRGHGWHLTTKPKREAA